ncbi:MAG TPA: 6-phosphofructokinase [Firmicutes bacterium]|nr:6-phosphofructokinase [Bacillota bacterium]
MNKIGILTSGGDSPGMNAAIRAVVRTAICSGMSVVGIEHGYQGTLDKSFREMGMRSVSDIVQRGGTILRTARCVDFVKSEVQDQAIANMREAGIEGLVVIGGDGSFRGAQALSLKGFPTVGIPGTIDNDLAYTDFTLGFHTACNTCLEAIDRIRDTSSSHDRFTIIEVMGRHCGDIALYTGIAGGAEMIILPEVPMTFSEIKKSLIEASHKGKTSGLVVLAEGVCGADELMRYLQRETNLSIRATVLGHQQRGGSPSMRDRVLGAQFGYHAVNLLKKDVGNRVIGIAKEKIVDYDINEALAMPRKFRKDLYKLANVISQ